MDDMAAMGDRRHMDRNRSSRPSPNDPTHQILNFNEDSYLERTSRPFYAVVFLLPFIIAYEIGTILINTDILSQTQVRVMAFVWLQRFFEYLGCGGRLVWMAPPLVVIVILLAMHATSGKRWYICIADMVPMLGEFVLLAVPLIVLSLFLNSTEGPRQMNTMYVCVTRPCQWPIGLMHIGTVSGTTGSLLASIITGIGAGIYEELIFRLILISLLMMLFQDALGINKTNAIVMAVFISAALFSAHHHLVVVDGVLGQSVPIMSPAFMFRTMAGIYFAILFAARGFGITAGTHAFYDILATLLNAAFFHSGI